MRKRVDRSDILTPDEIDALLNPVDGKNHINELTELLEKLENMRHEELWNELEQYPVEKLESLAVRLYKNHSSDGFDRKFLKEDLLRRILSTRFTKLNSVFEWTQENKERFLKVNDTIMRVFEKAYNEALPIAKELNRRSNSNDDFIKDYEVEIELHLYLYG